MFRSLGSFFRSALFSAAALAIASSSAHAGIFADAWTSYAQGTIDPAFATYSNPTTALEKPNDDVNVNMPWGYGALTPSNATWQDIDMVGIGAGGHLVLHLGRTASMIGVHAGVGLIDVNWPNGDLLDPAFPYTAPRSASVSVSADDITYFPLGHSTFELPTNFYDQGISSPSNATSPGTHEANFAQPFTGTLADFSGLDWAQTLTLLDGSAGGTWFDVTGVLPGGANFIRFDVGDNEIMFVDAVATQAIPEPSIGLMLVAPAMLAMRRCRRAKIG